VPQLSAHPLAGIIKSLWKVKSIKMRLKIIILCSFSLVLGVYSNCYSQDTKYDTIVQSITAKVKTITGNDYYITGLDIDKSLNDPETEDGKIKNPYHTLLHCFLFIAGGVPDSNYNKPKGFIGIYKIGPDSIVWRSELITDDFGGTSRIAETDEINADRRVEIIIAQASGALAQYEQIWIFNWNGKTGKLISQQDKDGTSTIFTTSDPSYSLVDKDGDDIYEIIGNDIDAQDNTIEVTYSWNGFLYGKWGKPSGYFKKKK
jgi:hypothetical protein